MLLVVYLYAQLGKMKVRATLKGEVDQNRRALHEDAWPDYVIQINNNIHNQFEIPVLFYAVSMIFWMMGEVSIFVLMLCVAFVGTRFFHTYIHIGANDVLKRRKVFSYGCYIVLALVVYAFILLLLSLF